MKIRYIGKKASKTDNLYGTGIIWNGTGDVQEVPGNAGHKLILHTDCWEAVGPVPPIENEPQVPATRPEEEMTEMPPLVDLSNMTKGDLEEYALAHFNVNLDKRKNKDSLVHEVTTLMNTINRFGG